MANNMLERLEKKAIQKALFEYPAVAILGPRQVGKTTLAKQILEDRSDVIMLDLERPSDLAKLQDAEAYLSLHKEKTICIDEVQLRPELFPLLRVLIDDDRKRNGRFLILGSSSPDLLRQSSESLAGRISHHYVTPFVMPEVKQDSVHDWRRLLWRGGYPDSYLALDDDASFRWRENYVQTFVQRDLRLFGVDRPPEQMRRLWVMLSHCHGQVTNYTKLGQSLDATHPTIKAHLDILCSTFMMRRLLPLTVNTKKRLVKSPKHYVRDTGLLCYLLEIKSFEDLYSHPAYGMAWEGFAVETILSTLKPQSNVGFYRSHKGEEIDLAFDWEGERVGFEFKVGSSPKLTSENYRAMETLELNRLYVITPECETYSTKGGTILYTSLAQFLVRQGIAI